MNSTSKLGRDGRFWGLLMMAPTSLGLMILNIIPFFQTIYMSFSKTKAFGAYQFCGLENYLEMFRNAEFWKANWNSIYFCILTVPVGVFLALIVAVLLNAKIKGKTAFRAIFFLPMVVAPAAVAMVWKWIFNAEYGILNQVLGTNIRWLTDPKIVLVTCAIVSIWSSIGYDAVLLLSGQVTFAVGNSINFPVPVRSRRAGRCIQDPPVLQHYPAHGIAHPVCGAHHAADGFPEGLRSDLHDGGADEPCADQRTEPDVPVLPRELYCRQ